MQQDVIAEPRAMTPAPSYQVILVRRGIFFQVVQRKGKSLLPGVIHFLREGRGTPRVVGIASVCTEFCAHKNQSVFYVIAFGVELERREGVFRGCEYFLDFDWFLQSSHQKFNLFFSFCFIAR